MSTAVTEVNTILRELNAIKRQSAFINGARRKAFLLSFDEAAGIAGAITERIWRTADGSAEQRQHIALLERISPLWADSVRRTLSHRHEALNREAMQVPALEINL